MSVSDLVPVVAAAADNFAAKDTPTGIPQPAPPPPRAELHALLQPIEQRIDRLSLICRAMWSLIHDHTNLTEADLAKRVTEIDALDGVVDGRVTPQPVPCPQCNSQICRKFNRCLFCGYEYKEGSPFDTV